MRLPLSWLAELVEGLPDAAALSDLLPGLGLGVEEVVELPAAPEGVVVVEIVEAKQVEGSEHLLRTVVNDGERRHEVVCGAPNARVGVRSALALPGTKLPAADLTVEPREIHGVASHGMLGSPRELGLYDAGGGIVAFGPDAPLGASLHELWPAETVLELELTPNRADAFSVLGVARDLAAKLAVPLRHPAAGAVPGDEEGSDELAVEIADEHGCPHLVLQRIDGLSVGPSPLWLQRRLAALGLRPRNNVVDATNYVTYELGQPSHAYDRRVLQDGRLQVRRAREGERVVLLDGEPRTLDADDLVIATPGGGTGPSSKAVGLAGVMGGLEDSVREDTASVALEVAHFDPVSVRKTAKRHGIHSDAHHRFERGVDPALPPVAAAHAAQLIALIAGGTVHPAVSRAGGATVRPEIAFRPARVEFLMAFDVPPATQRRYLEALGCRVRSAEDPGAGAATAEAGPLDDVLASSADVELWHVRPPSWRFDLEIEEDLVEEVARLHGYEHVGATRPDLAFTPPPTDPTHRGLRDELAAKGLQEILAYVFTGDEEVRVARAPEPSVRLSNPQGIERAVLRTALHPGLLSAAAANRGEPGLAFFEIGRVFGSVEEERLALLLSGRWDRQAWRSDEAGDPVDFWRLKGLLESLAERRNARLELRAADSLHAPMLHPGVAAIVHWNGREIGLAGRIHPEVGDAYELGEAYLAELRLPLEGTPLTMRDVPRQPYAERDLAVVAPREVPYAELVSVARDAAGEQLTGAWPFDVYQGPPLSENERSVALRLRWRHPTRALRDEEVDARLSEVIGAIRAAGWSIRG